MAGSTAKKGGKIALLVRVNLDIAVEETAT
jgi:hypothetical protein